MPKFTVHGKLYLAGEYAIVYGLSPAIIMRTRQALHISAELVESGYVSSNQFKEGTLFYTWQTYSTDFHEHAYIQRALHIVQRYLTEKSITLQPVGIELKSELDHHKNQKYGLGSSATLTVGLIKSICALHGVVLSPLELYKLSVLSQFYDFPHSSYGDIACVAFDAWVYYQKFDLDFLNQQDSSSIVDLCSIAWPQLQITTLEPLQIDLLVAYTNQTADSHKLVKTVSAHQTNASFIEFSKMSHQLVTDLHQSWNKLKTAQVLTLMSALQLNLEDLATLTQAPLITHDMNRIDTLIKQHQGILKLSGAGGGDCVLCFFPTNTALVRAQSELESVGYETFMIDKELL